MIDRLVALYKQGAVTADHLVLECLNAIDPKNPGSALGPLPDEVLDRVLEFARQYRPDRMRTNYGALPSPDQAAAARTWIASRRAAVGG